MAVDDLWYLSKKGADGKRIPSQRYGRGKRYRVRWTDPETGRDRTELFDKKSDAGRADANRRADISRGQYIDPSAGKVTVGDYWDEWRGRQIHRDSTADMVERAGRLHIKPLLGELPMLRVRPSSLQGWVKDRSSPGILAPSTVHTVWSYIVSMFAAAVLDRVIGTSPCVGVTLPAVLETERFIPSPAQVHALARELPERYRPVPYLAAGCGLRGGEIFGLEEHHVPFLQREVRVTQQLRYQAGRGRYVGPPKTRTSRRIVELAEVAGLALAEHLRKYPPMPYSIEDDTGTRTVAREMRPLFVTSNGYPLIRSTWNGVWTVAVRKAGLPKGFGLHGLRHYYATLLIHGGASVKTVQLALGHANPTITLNTYAHEWPDVTDRTRALVDAALGACLDPSVEVAQ